MPPISLSDLLHSRPLITPTIYVYEVTNMPDHKGYVKVGYTDKEATEDRIKEQTHTVGAKYRILYTESALRSDGTCFTDNDVHNALRRRKIKQLNQGTDRNEWFNCSVDTVKTAIKEVKTNKRIDDQRSNDFKMRQEQQNAVDMTIEYYNKAKIEDPGKPPKFLWNAKMRFGKTFATYELAKKMEFKRILVLTFKPAVEDAWQSDLNGHVDFKGWHFVSNTEAKFDAVKLNEQFKRCNKNDPIVVFGSFQDLLGTNESGGIKAKNEFIHETNWDLVVFDEYHFGAWRENAKKLFEKYDEEDVDEDIEKYQREEAGNAINETWLPITTSHYLFLSGTPFRALVNGEFLEDQIFNWTYSDEQNAKENWKGTENNPYAALPKMYLLTYKIPDSIVEVAVNEGYDGFDINEFFKAENDGDVEKSRFIYEEYVQKWLDLIRGKGNFTDGLKLGSDRPPMPFSDTTLLNVLSHTLWFLPNVASCYAMANLLKQKQNNFFGEYKIIVCAGNKAGIGLDALYPVESAMGDPLKTKTITLSCGKLTTGVTVRPWTGVFMLRNLKSPETYFQTAFRVQSPWVVKDENGNDSIVKEECYVFDFALERALSQIADYSDKLNTNNSSTEQKVSEFINFLPVLAFDGSSMNRVDAKDILDITYAGTSATLLAKRWQTALLVHVDNKTLINLQNNPAAMEALMKIEGFRNLNKELSTIINRSEKVKKIKEKDGLLTVKEKKELDEAQKEMKSLRKQVQEKLLKLAARIPSFMYLTDFREQSIKDVITQLEPALFFKVTGLSVSDFELLVSIGLFDSEKMNQGVFGFRRYEDASLTYTGIDKHEGEAVGGWDTVLSREDYDELYAKQQDTMESLSMVFSEAMGLHTAEKETEEKDDVKTNKKEETERFKTAYGAIELTTEEISMWEKKLCNIKIGDSVENDALGKGKIYSITKARIGIKYAGGTKNYVFPDAFLLGTIKTCE